MQNDNSISEKCSDGWNVDGFRRFFLDVFVFIGVTTVLGFAAPHSH